MYNLIISFFFQILGEFSLNLSDVKSSVIIDVVRQSNPSEGVGAAFHDTGTKSIIDNVKLMSKVYEMAVKGWRVGRGDVMNA